MLGGEKILRFSWMTQGTMGSEIGWISQGKRMGYKIGSFNLRNMGLSALGENSSRDLSKIAEIIRGEQLDVIALQEVLSEGKAIFSPDYARKSLLMELGSDCWDFRWADVGTQSLDRRGEGYAFIWNTRRLRLATTKIMGDDIRVFEPQVCDINKADMIRRPFYARFTPTDTLAGGPWVEFRLLCVHTYFGNDDTEARKKRQKELDVLMKEIYPRISDRRYGLFGNGMPSYTLIMGDYNVVLWRRWKDDTLKKINAERLEQGKQPYKKPAVLVADKNDEVEIADWGNRKIKTVQYEPTTVNDERGYVNDYDHFSYEEKRFAGVHMKAKRIDAVRKYCKDDFETYLKIVSDHIPIMMEIEFREP